MTATTQDRKYPETLAGSLAVFQANPPKIGKGNTAEVKNDQGKKLYVYDYADLADVNAKVLPRLGAVGLAFTSRPTMLDGQFVLAYSLVHVSGEREDGVYPLQANLAPQKIGGLITYARRYCLCAVTGVAAAGDDDDAAGAQDSHRQSAADAFENAAAQQQPRRAERMARVPSDDPWYGAAPPDDGPSLGDRLIGEAATFTTEATADRIWRDAAAAAREGLCTPDQATHVQNRVRARVRTLRQSARPVHVGDLARQAAQNASPAEEAPSAPPAEPAGEAPMPLLPAEDEVPTNGDAATSATGRRTGGGSSEPDDSDYDTPGTRSGPQLKAIWTILNTVFKFGNDEKDQARAVCAHIIGHPLESTNDLSHNEAKAVLDTLANWREAADRQDIEPRAYLVGVMASGAGVPSDT